MVLGWRRLAPATPFIVLFNTLAYARFITLVFVAIWLLVERRNGLWLPWMVAAGFVAFAAPSAIGLGVVAALFVVTWAATRRLAADARPSTAQTALLVLAHGTGLVWLAQPRFHADPLSLALRALNMPLLPWAAARYGLLVAVLVAFVVLLRAKRLRLLFIVAASYVFYAHWNWRYLPLIWGSSTLDYWLGLRIGKTEDPRRRRVWLLATVIANLGILGLFK